MASDSEATRFCVPTVCQARGPWPPCFQTLGAGTLITLPHRGAIWALKGKGLVSSHTASEGTWAPSSTAGQTGLGGGWARRERWGWGLHSVWGP